MNTELDEAISELVDITVHMHPQITQEPSLLSQLEDAIRSSSGNGGASKAAPNERSPLNPAALAIRDEIRQEVAEWCVRSGIRAGRKLAGNLKRWHAANPDAGDWYVNELRRFARMIRGHFTNRKPAPVGTPCPVCKATEWTDRNGDVHVGALERSHIDGELLTTARVRCNACGAEWPDLEAVFECADELRETGALDTPEPDDIPIKEAARRLRCTRRTVERKVEAGELKAVKVGWHTRITLESVNKAIEKKHASNRARA